MAVIITDMDMPKSCFDCDLHNYHFCDATGTLIEKNRVDGTRAGDCPLKSVDEMIEEIQQKHVHCFERIDFDTAYGLCCALNIIKKYCDGE